MRLRHLYLLGLTLLLLAACGKKGPVRPLEETLPQAVQTAEILQRGAGFQLRWQLPQQNLDGSALSDLESIEIERIFSSESEFCAQCPDPWPLIAKVYPELPAPAQKVGQLYLLSEAGIPPAQFTIYRLRARNRLGRLGEPLILKQRLREPQTAPQGLTIQAHDSSLELHWQAAPVPEGATLIGYQVYRRSEGQPFLPLATNPRPLAKPQFSDFNLQNGHNFHYRVRSLFDFAGQRLESLPGSEVSATPAAG